MGCWRFYLLAYLAFLTPTRKCFVAQTVPGLKSHLQHCFFCVPLLATLWVLDRLDFWPMGQLKNILDTRVAPLFSKCRWWELLLIAVFAGLGEELLFRWCLQGGLQTTASLDAFNAIIVCSVLFGLCHSLSTQYFWFSFCISIYLGVAMNASGSVIVPAFAHCLYDFFALLIIRQRYMELPSDFRDQIAQALNSDQASASLSDPKL